MTKKSIVEKYIRKFPKTPNLTLAKKIFEDNPLMFQSIESLRGQIRTIKGANGKGKLRQAIPDLIENRIDQKNPFNLPESYAEDWNPYVIPKNANRTLLLNDIHLPYHNIPALTLALKYGKENGCNTIIVNGDLLDFYQISRFDKNPNKKNMRVEFDQGRDFFKVLRKNFPNAHIYYKLGNHEERWEKYLMVKAPELFGVPEFELQTLLRLAEFGVHYITDKRIIELGHLSILHGHEFLGATSQAVNPARGLFMKTNESCIIGHLHKTSEHTETTLSGKILTTWSCGCLCELHPDYARINKWNHGFAFIEVSSDGNYTLQNKRIYNNTIL